MYNIFTKKFNQKSLTSDDVKIIEINQFSGNICIYKKEKFKRKTEKN